MLWRVSLCGAAPTNSLLPLQEKLERVILGSKAAQQHPEEVRGLWQTCGELMFSLAPRLRHLGLGKEVRYQVRGREKASSQGLRAGGRGRQQALPYACQGPATLPSWPQSCPCEMGIRTDTVSPGPF